MKGISLPVNLMVVLIVGLVCLAGIIAYLWLFKPSTGCKDLFEVSCILILQGNCEKDWDELSQEIVKYGDKICSIGDIASDLGIGGVEYKKRCGC